MATGNEVPRVRLVASTSSALRLAHATRFLHDTTALHPTLIVAASRGAADDVARHALASVGTAGGWHRFSVPQLAARLALNTLAASGRLPSSPLGAEAVAARAIFAASGGGALTYFAPVAHTPGFPRAVARTIGELRLSGAVPAAVSSHGMGGPDLAALLAEVEREFQAAGAADRALLLATATESLRARSPQATALVDGHRLLLLDLQVGSRAEAGFLAALVKESASALITTPAGDADAERRLADLAGVPLEYAEEAETSGLGRLRRRIFQSDVPLASGDTADVQMFSAPGEAREAVEIARRMLAEAARGVRFDEMAVLVRAPQQYLGLLEHALARAAIPAWFDRGTRRPDPAGRALLALLFCAEEGLSARRFAEYLSLAQVPDPIDATMPAALVAPDDDVLSAGLTDGTSGDEVVDPPDRDSALPALPVVDGALRAPWRWEALLVESAVIGGRDRWVTRLDGLEHEYRRRLEELRADEPEAPRVAALARDLEHLGHLRAFALPLSNNWTSGATASSPGGRGWIASIDWRRACCASRHACCACSRSSGRCPRSGPSEWARCGAC